MEGGVSKKHPAIGMHFGGPDEASRRFVGFYRALSFKNARARCPNAVQPRTVNALQTPLGQAKHLLCGGVVGLLAGKRDNGRRVACTRPSRTMQSQPPAKKSTP